MSNNRRREPNITFIEKLVEEKKWRPTNIICTMLLIILLAVAFLLMYIFYVNEIQDSAAKKTLYFWADAGRDSAFAEYLTEVTEAYNSKNGDTEIVLRTDFRDYTASVTYAYVKGYQPAEDNKTPDINLISGQYIGDILAIKNIMPLNDNLGDTALGEYALRTSGMAAKNINIKDGVLYALPLFVNTYRLVYNQDIFLAAGLDPAHGPSDTAELTAAHDKVIDYSNRQELSLRGYMMTTADMGKWLFAAEQIGMAGGTGTFDFTTLTRCYSNLCPIIEIFTQPKFVNLKYRPSENTIMSEFFAGTTVMTMADYETMRSAESENEDSTVKWNSSQVPYLAGSEPSGGTLFSDVTYIHINGNTKYKEAAVSFLEYLLSDEVIAGFATKCEKIPATWKFLNKTLTDIGADAAYQSFFEFENDTVQPLIPRGQIVSGDDMATLYEEIVKGNTDAEEAMRGLDERENNSLRTAIENGTVKESDYIMGGEPDEE